MKIVFMGTPASAVSVLQDLIKARHEIICVVTQPDRPRGRGRKLAASPVKEFALQHDLPLEQPEKVRHNPAFAASLRALSPDVIVVVAYGQILPKELLEIPKHACINVHASLLPKYRGAAPIQWALLNGETETGVTIMRMDEGLDTGDIVLQDKVGITETDDALTLSQKIFKKGGGLLLAALDQLSSGKAAYHPQRDSGSTQAPSIKRESGEIDWRKSAQEIHNRIRALVPWPGAHTFRCKKLFKIWRSELHAPDIETREKQPGTIVGIVKNTGFIVATGSGNILLKEVQAEGKKRLAAYDYVIGHDVEIGETLPN